MIKAIIKSFFTQNQVIYSVEFFLSGFLNFLHIGFASEALREKLTFEHIRHRRPWGRGSAHRFERVNS
jgi:hypothetical protein